MFFITLVYPIILYFTVCHSVMGLIVIPNYKLSYINTGILMKWAEIEAEHNQINGTPTIPTINLYHSKWSFHNGYDHFIAPLSIMIEKEKQTVLPKLSATNWNMCFLNYLLFYCFCWYSSLTNKFQSIKIRSKL